jgi:hypothetical protein
MIHPVKVKDLILGKYEVQLLLAQSRSYQWLESFDKKNNKTYIIQLLLSDLPSDTLTQTFDYFDNLKNLSHKTLLTPEQVISHQKFPLVVLYPQAVYTDLNFSKDQNINSLIEKIKEASETLHILHNKGLTHGYINPKSFVLKDGKACLMGFGYAPILTKNNPSAFQDCSDILSPKILNVSPPDSSSLVTPLTDIYCFAKTVAYWLPDITESLWYSKATSLDSSPKFTRIRELFSELEKTLISLYFPQTEIIDLPPQQEINLLEESNTKGGLILKHSLEITVEPPEAGRVLGNGVYKEGKEVRIEAIAFPDWEFIGWQGDIIESKKDFGLVVTKDLKLTAQFREIPKSTATITINIFPLAAQEFVKVVGAGNYPLGTTVHIQAWSISEQWCFSGWEGDINNSSNPVIISVDDNKQIMVKFELVPDFADSKRLKNNQPGDAFNVNPKDIKSTPNKSYNPKSNQLIGGAFDVTDDRDNQQVTTEQSSQNNQSQTSVGKAFFDNETEKSLPVETLDKKESKKPIIGTAFNN